MKIVKNEQKKCQNLDKIVFVSPWVAQLEATLAYLCFSTPLFFLFWGWQWQGFLPPPTHVEKKKNGHDREEGFEVILYVFLVSEALKTMIRLQKPPTPLLFWSHLFPPNTSHLFRRSKRRSEDRILGTLSRTPLTFLPPHINDRKSKWLPPSLLTSSPPSAHSSSACSLSA